MNPASLKEAEKLFTEIAKNLKVKKTEVVICPPFIYLESLFHLLKAKSYKLKAILGGQNSFLGETGAFTGEISTGMLYNIGARYVILGHSERRAMGESNNNINKKIKAALSAGLVPIVCVGEQERDQAHNYFNIVKMQVEECLNGVNKTLFSKIIIAYEPVWALSSTPNRRDAKPLDSNEMAIFIRKILSDLSSPQIVALMRVIYGGSVTDKDARDFLEHGGVDGVLPGRASLNAKKFVEIINIAESL